MDNMTRDDGWRFPDHRSPPGAPVLPRPVRRPFPDHGVRQRPRSLEWLLDLMDSIITYRSRFFAPPELLPVVDLLVFDDSNPHGVLFQASVLTPLPERMARELGGDIEGDLAGAIERLRAFDLEKLEHLPAIRSYNCALRLNWPACCDLDSCQSALRLAGHALFHHVGDVSRQTMALVDHGRRPLPRSARNLLRLRQPGVAVAAATPPVAAILAWQQVEEQCVDIEPTAELAARWPRCLWQPGDLGGLPCAARPPAHPFGDDHRRRAPPAG